MIKCVVSVKRLRHNSTKIFLMSKSSFLHTYLTSLYFIFLVLDYFYIESAYILARNIVLTMLNDTDQYIFSGQLGRFLRYPQDKRPEIVQVWLFNFSRQPCYYRGRNLLGEQLNIFWPYVLAKKGGGACTRFLRIFHVENLSDCCCFFVAKKTRTTATATNIHL